MAPSLTEQPEFKQDLDVASGLTARPQPDAGVTATPSGVVSQHFVTFYSPGTFVAETSAHPVRAWDVKAAVKLADEITERHGATPYGFRFNTRSRGPDDLDSRTSATSSMYFLGGRVETLAEVEARNDPKESILRGNMRGNGYDRVIVNDNSWRWTQPLSADDVVLDYTPPKLRGDQ